MSPSISVALEGISLPVQEDQEKLNDGFSLVFIAELMDTNHLSFKLQVVEIGCIEL